MRYQVGLMDYGFFFFCLTAPAVSAGKANIINIYRTVQTYCAQYCTYPRTNLIVLYSIG